MNLRDFLYTFYSFRYFRCRPSIEKLENEPSFEEKYPKALDIINNAKSEILICSGEFSGRYYDVNKTLKAFSKKLREGVKITVSAGPALAFEDKDFENFKDFREKYSKFISGEETLDEELKKKFIYSFIKIKKALCFLILGRKVKRKSILFNHEKFNKIEFYLKSKRSPVHFIMADQKDIIYFGNHFGQEKPKKEDETVLIFYDYPHQGQRLSAQFYSELENSSSSCLNFENFPELIKVIINANLVDTRSNLKEKKKKEWRVGGKSVAYNIDPKLAEFSLN
jgi:sugar-specific transcriptional regulator TrmB